jgi:hypothetical protein
MLQRKTVFVIGAGASQEFNLPVGTVLAEKISKKLDVKFDHWKQTTGDSELFDSIRQAFHQEAKEYQKAGWLIRDGIILANSIDDFLHVHRHDARVVAMGKAAIAKCILEAERSSKLHYSMRDEQSTINFAACADTWLVKLMRLLGRGVAHADRGTIFDRCAFIVFNYDRCIEHFFIHALSRFYNIDQAESKEIVSKAIIYHPYGTPGALKDVPFGSDRSDWARLATAIKTYTETVEASEIRQAISDAAQFVFLGFAYHDQNMSLLAEKASLDPKSIIGTAYQRSESDVKVITTQAANWIKPPYRNLMLKNFQIRNDLTASTALDYFSKSL